VSSINVDVHQHGPGPPKKHAVLSFIESAAGTALLTVVLGGLVGQLISCDVQNRLRERDFNETWLKARGEQATAPPASRCHAGCISLLPSLSLVAAAGAPRPSLT
jgi:hypothetical protein